MILQPPKGKPMRFASACWILSIMVSTPAFAHFAQCNPPESSARIELDYVLANIGSSTVLRYYDEYPHLVIEDGPMRTVYSAQKTTYTSQRFTFEIIRTSTGNLIGTLVDRLGEVKETTWFCSVLGG